MKETINKIIENQRVYFRAGETRSVAFRMQMLMRLKKSILNNEEVIAHALHLDLGKSEAEVVSTEIGFTLNEINTVMKHLKRWSRKEKVKTNLFNLPGKSYTVREPYGVTLLMGPWNYPFQLVMSPLIGAIAGGNTAVVKPSEISAHTAEIIEKVLFEAFKEEYVAVVQGGVPETNALLEHRFDKIFFTGSTRVGSIIMEKAAKHLTPVVLELGGKSPTIIDRTANIEVAVNRIVFGKGTNAGQTCVAPDYVLVHEDVKETFYNQYRKTVEAFYSESVIENNEFGKMINRGNYERVKAYMKDGKIVYGGHVDDENLKIGLTLVEVTDMDTAIMKEEIFGPVLPVVTYTRYEDILKVVRQNPDPLALYLFSEDRTFIEKVIHDIPFGGGCVNDTIMHLTNEHLPFGGRGPSGMGNYHGRHSFDAFTHEKSILYATTKFDLKLKYPPFMRRNIGLVKRIMYGE